MLLTFTKGVFFLIKFFFFFTDFTAAGVNKFVGVPTLMTWVDAQSYCRQHYTDLASSFNLSDNNLLQQVATTLGFSFFGLFRDEWKWVDGTQVDKLLWQSPLPDNADPPEDCGTLTSGKRDDKKCTNLYNFFCDTGEFFTTWLHFQILT